MRHPQYEHQAQDLERSRDEAGWGWWWEMGLGKAKQCVDTAEYLFLKGRIDAVLVLAPNGVHANWCGVEVPEHASVEWRGLTWYTERADTKRQREASADILLRKERTQLRWLAMSYDAINTAHGIKLATTLLKSSRCLIAADESTAIKTPKARRSMRALALAKMAPYRRAMDGTAWTESPFDMFNQVRFLYNDYWDRIGTSTFFEFKMRFGDHVLARAGQGHQFQKFIRYRDLDRLGEHIAKCSTRYLKKDCLDLPEKVYSRLVFDMTPYQRRQYDNLRDEYVAQFDSGERCEAMEAMVRATRLQQITCGYVGVAAPQSVRPGDEVLALVPTQAEDVEVLGVLERMEGDVAYVQGTSTESETFPDGRLWQLPAAEVEARCRPIGKAPTVIKEIVEPKDNPRLQLLLATLEKAAAEGAKTIVWCRFVRDVDIICAALPGKHVRYDGSVGTRERAAALVAFRESPECPVLVANAAAIARGVTLVQATVVIYYSNSFNIIHRLQSEDRAHRIGQKNVVRYYDIVAADSIDEHISKVLARKQDVAGQLDAATLREWL